MHPDQFSSVIGNDSERGVSYQVDAPLRGSGILGIRERISEHDLECIQDLFFAIDVDGLAVDVVEGPDVIQSAGMVHVVVGQEYGIDVGDVLAQHLGAEIRTGVHEYP